MKKVSLILVLCIFAWGSLQAQVNNFRERSSAINLGIGFGSTIYINQDMSWPSFSASYEYGIIDIPMGSDLIGVISAGGSIGVGGLKKDYVWGKVNTVYTMIAARGNYHFIFHDKFDPYAGIIIGYYFGNTHEEVNPGGIITPYDIRSNGVHGGAYAGARWFFTPGIAVFAEFGWNISILTVGATFKF